MEFLMRLIRLIKNLLGLGGPLVSEPPDSIPPFFHETINEGTTYMFDESNITNDKPEKYALLVGINKYSIPNADLNGCVNDVNAMWEILVKEFGFKPDNIRVLVDERATKQAILKRLHWLTGSAKDGDFLVFHFSGHGSFVRDRSGDELDDNSDELVVTYDHSWDNPLIDDEIALAFKNIPEGAFLTFISDSCHSGSVSREIVSEQKAKYIHPPLDIVCRSRDRDLAISKIGWVSNTRGINDITRLEDQRHMLISGCRDNQTSADATFNGVWRGALTYTLLNIIRENPDANWLQIHEKVIAKLKASNFSQVPQLSGPSKMLERKPFDFI